MDTNRLARRFMFRLQNKKCLRETFSLANLAYRHTLMAKACVALILISKKLLYQCKKTGDALMPILIPEEHALLISFPTGTADISVLPRNCMILSSTPGSHHSCKPIPSYQSLGLVLLVREKKPC
jgi:Na+-transporting NADH:ubiquinone oxidoreductase subunit NqrF